MFKRLIQFLFSKQEEIGFDNYLVLVLSFNISIIGLLGTIINILLQLGWVLIVSTFIPFVAFAGLFILSRVLKKHLISKNILIVFSIIMINVQWIVNFGSYGPILYLFVVLQCFVLILFGKRGKIFFSLLILINVTTLFLIEYKYPNIFGQYASEHARLLDLYWGMLIYLGLSILMINIALTFYIRQKEKAEKSDQLKTSFLANMSHEIRTPMNAIIGFGQLLYNRSQDENQRKFLNIINSNSFHLLKLIDDIIDVSKIESNQLKIFIENFSVNDLFEDLEQTMLQYLKRYNKPNIQLICNKPDENLIISSDYTRIKQVLTNLLSNAIKFSSKGSVVYGCLENRNGVTFYVQDAGIGIKEKDLHEIFQRFVKVENKTNDKVYRGTGLGLSISRQIVELLNGNIWVESEFGKGSKFQFTIPTKILHHPKKKSIESIENQEQIFSGQLILIAEDEEDNYHYLSDLLSIHKLETIRANNGAEAIELLKIVPDISLILMDIKMPIMGGEEALIQVRKLNPEIPVFAQTAYAMENDKEYFLQKGFDEYISKPIQVESLIALIAKHLIKD